jgi:hypothetical protein
MDDESAEIVATCEAAMSYLGEHGRAVKDYLDRRGRACLAGALAIARIGETESLRGPDLLSALNCPAIPAVAEVICDRYWGLPRTSRPSRATLFAVEDRPETTDEDVIEVLRETIKRHTPDAYRPAPTEEP